MSGDRSEPEGNTRNYGWGGGAVRPFGLGSTVTIDRRTGIPDRECRLDLVGRSIARAREFSWERTARQTLQVFEELA
jgi:hypothetical protein